MEPYIYILYLYVIIAFFVVSIEFEFIKMILCDPIKQNYCEQDF